ncbi:MAG: CatB-related O-acetyltransferase [Flavobacteriales bacterium]|nr:CatB-related O-acetyltransferase [Flavobacteriales bacterium]
MIHRLWRTYLRLKHSSCTINAARIGRNIKLENNVTIAYGCHVNSPKIGKYTFLNKNTIVDANVDEIGRFCSIAYNVKIGLGNHPINWVSTHPFAYAKKYGFVEKDREFEDEVKKQCNIGHDVWIGANSTILAGVQVGHGAIIGANALVNQDVPPYAIVVGSPAKILRYRFDEETIGKLLKLEWWNWPEEKIRSKIDLFKDPSLLNNS